MELPSGLAGDFTEQKYNGSAANLHFLWFQAWIYIPFAHLIGLVLSGLALGIIGATASATARTPRLIAAALGRPSWHLAS